MNPVVPTTAWIPLSIKNFRLSITTSGCVKSMTTSVWLSVNMLSGSPASTPAVNVRSSCGLDGLNHGGADLALGAKHSDSHGLTLASAVCG